jgi:DNA/RNA endonuclease YhcR with UshA esterase domain
MNKLPAMVLVFCMSSAWAAQPVTQPAQQAPAAAPSVQGEVLETLDADVYTYLKLKTKQGEVWAAVNKAPVKKGAQVTIENPMLMTNFESKTLKRKFDKILFGTLGGTAAAGTTPGKSAAESVSHSNPARTEDVPAGSIPKATGPDARTIAEIYAQSAQLNNKPVVVRGKVVKFASKIMGKNWLHLKDGTGKGADGTNDLVVTTMDPAKAGEVVTVKGTLRTDVDIGMGVKYRVLVEDAKLTR